MDLGIRISCWLKAKGRSQRQLAIHLGITPGAITAWVKGTSDPNYAHLTKLVEWLGITMVQFHGRIPAAKKAAKKAIKRAA